MRRFVTGIAAVAVWIAHTAAAAPLPEFFSPGSVWNRPLPADQPLHPDSGPIVAELMRQMEAYGGPWLNIEQYSVPIVRVPPHQPTIRVTRPAGLPRGPYAWGRVPVPPGARPSEGTDRHLVVWQPSTDTMWEFWHFQRTARGATAGAGARIPRVSRSAGVIPAPFGATASGLPAAAGVITARDLRAGRIDHALAIAIPEPLRAQLTPPATRTDGWSTNPDAPMEGSRFRLDPGLDIASLRLHPLVRMIADAAQRHGLIVRDQAGAVVFYGQAPSGAEGDVFTRILGHADRKALLRTFPWRHLQALPTTPRCCWRAPVVRPVRHG